MTACALHADHAGIVRPARDRRIVRAHLHALRRHVPVRVAVGAARMEQHAARLEEQRARALGFVLDNRKGGGLAQMASVHSWQRHRSLAAAAATHHQQNRDCMHSFHQLLVRFADSIALDDGTPRARSRTSALGRTDQDSVARWPPTQPIARASAGLKVPGLRWLLVLVGARVGGLCRSIRTRVDRGTRAQRGSGSARAWGDPRHRARARIR